MRESVSRERRPQRLILLALLMALPSVALAIDPTRAVTQYVHRSWGVEDGLPTSGTSAIAQTPDGYLWVGTEHGLARFDGVHVTVFNLGNTPQIGDDEVVSLVCDRRGALWIGTLNGVSVYDGGSFRRLGMSDGLPSGPFYALYVSHAGDVWTATNDAVFVRHGGAFHRVTPSAVGFVTSFAETPEGLWLAGTQGLELLAGNSTRIFTVRDGLPDARVISLTAIGHDLWVGTGRGAVRVSRGVVEFSGVPEVLRDREIWAMLVDRDGAVWFGTRHGAVRLRNGKVDTFTAADGLSDDYVSSFFEDRDGSIWIATRLGGINQLLAGPITTYTKREGLRADVVWSVFDDGRRVFVGTEGGGLATIAGGRVTPFGPHDGFQGSIITSTARDREGTLWVGTYDRGVFRLRDGQWSSITKRDGLSDDTVTSLLDDGPALWVGTRDGITRIEQGQMRRYGRADGLGSCYAIAMHRDARGRLWAGTNGGLYLLEGDRFVDRVGTTVLPRVLTYSIHEAADGTIWAGTHTGVASITPAGQLRILTTRDGLPVDDVFQIEQDRAGNFWMSSVHGIFGVLSQEMERGRITSVLLLDRADGMASAEGTAGVQPSSWASADGSIWFSTYRGAARLDPVAAIAGRGAAQPRLQIESVVVDGKEQTTASGVDLAPGTEKLEFHYTAPYFLAPNRLRFRYQLVGYDRGWIEAGSRRVAYYTHLPPGHYQFRAMANDGRGPWSEHGSVVSLVLHPRFMETVWFYMVLILVAVLVGALLVAARGRRIRARYERRIRARYATVLDERTRIAREFHDTLAQDLVALWQQVQIATDALGAKRDEDHILGALESARTLANRCLTGTRRSLHDLRAEVLDRSGLASAVQTIAAEVRGLGAIDPKVTISGTPRLLDGRVEQNILRIAQEAVNNAVKHSGAKSLAIVLQFHPARVEMLVSDDGSGPPSLTDSGPQNLGLLGIQERAREIGATLRLTGARGRGTTVHLVVPTSGDEVHPTLTSWFASRFRSVSSRSN